MFYHGIDRKYVFASFPVLSPRREVSSKDGEQLKDRRHLLEQFGLEPIHLLEEREDFPRHRCLAECFRFGDTVFAFARLHDPLWQLSRREVGVVVLDLRQAAAIYTQSLDPELKTWFPDTPMYPVSTFD